jgi:hypothetical protein
MKACVEASRRLCLAYIRTSRCDLHKHAAEHEVLQMCRSIKTLRPPYSDEVTEADIHAAALQYVRKIAGMRAPARVNQVAFDAAVAKIAGATEDLLAELVVRGRPLEVNRRGPNA